MTPPTQSPPPLLVGARARSGMVTLAARLEAAGIHARVFGHPARSPANRDALVASGLAIWAATFAAMVPSLSIRSGLLSVLATVLLSRGFAGWPRAAAWTVMVGHPDPKVIRRIEVLGLDVRRPRPWLFVLAGLAGVLVAGLGGSFGALGFAALVALVAAWDPQRARAVSVDGVADWVVARAGRPDTLVLVSTAGGGYGEGAEAVADWFQLHRSEVVVSVDEEGKSGGEVALRRAGFVVGPA